MGLCAPSKQPRAPTPSDDGLPGDIPDFDQVYGVGVMPTNLSMGSQSEELPGGGGWRKVRSEGSHATRTSSEDCSEDWMTPRFAGLRENSDYESTPRDRAGHREKWGDVRKKNLPQVDAAVKSGRIGRYTEFSMDSGSRSSGHVGVSAAGAPSLSQEYVCGVQERLAAKMAATRATKPGPPHATARVQGGRRSDPGPRPSFATGKPPSSRSSSSRQGVARRVPKIRFGGISLHYFTCTQHEGTSQPKSGGPGISMGSTEITRSAYKLSEFEKLRLGKRTPRERFHKSGRLSVADRVKILDDPTRSKTAW